MNLYEEAIKIWLARKYGPGKFWAEDISDINFVTAWQGGCPTCDYSETAIEFKITRSGESTYDTICVEHIPPARLIQECLEIYLTLSHQKGYAALA